MRAHLNHWTGQARQYWRRGGVRNLARGGLSGIAITLANRAFTFASAVVLARLLGADGYGIYAAAIAVMAILGVLAEFGMYVLLVREVAAAHGRMAWNEVLGMRANAMRFALVMSGVVGGIGCALIWLTPWVSNQNERVTLTFMLALLPINVLLRLGSAILSGLRRLTAAQLGELFIFPAITLTALLALYATLGKDLIPQQAMMAQVACGIAALTILQLMIRTAFAPTRTDGVQASAIRGFQRRAVPFLILGAAGTVAQQADTVIVSLFLTHAETGYYRVASQAATLTWFGVQIVQSISAPYFARLHQQGDVRMLRRLFGVTTILAIASAVPIVIIFIFFGSELLEFTFGTEFVSAHPVMIILSLGYLINVACGPVGMLLAMTGEERWASRAFLITTFIAVIISLATVQLIGPLGVAFGTAFHVGAYHLVLRYHAWRKLRI